MSYDAAIGPSPGSARRLRRRPDEGLLGGVCAGLARRLSLDVRVVRVLAVMAAGAGGVGVALYAVAWVVIPASAESRDRARSKEARLEGAAVLIGAVSLVWLLRNRGFGVEQSILWPLVVGLAGLALVWRPTDREPDALPPSAARGGAGRLRGLLPRSARVDWLRVLLGALMVAFASAALLHHFALMHSLGKAVGAVALVMVVAGVLAGPWFLRLWQSLGFERAARIRAQERAEMAAHLHDSVLQTLALIQKRSAEPREVAGLARRQERELRSWLLRGGASPAQETVAGALQRAAAEVEELHGVPVEVVTVGDGPIDPSLEALVQASREAMTNACKFAGADKIDLYAEVGPDGAEVYVRDRGVGFDTQAVPEDRRGLRDSIVGRMERHRGLATIRSRPGEGTEVELQMRRGVPA